AGAGFGCGGCTLAMDFGSAGFGGAAAPLPPLPFDLLFADAVVSELPPSPILRARLAKKPSDLADVSADATRVAGAVAVGASGTGGTGAATAATIASGERGGLTLGGSEPPVDEYESRARLEALVS